MEKLIESEKRAWEGWEVRQLNNKPFQKNNEILGNEWSAL